MAEHWFVRVRGEVRGPMDRSQVESLVRRQRLGRHDEVSFDGRNWRRAADHPELFPATVARKARSAGGAPAEDPLAVPSVVELEAPSLPDAAPEWHYASHGAQAGPVSLQSLRQLLGDGLVLPEDLVWKNGMPCWIPASQVGELAGYAAPQRPVTHPFTGARGRELSGMAVTSMILGILGLTVLPGVASIPAVVLGHFALGQIQREPDAYSGQGQAITGVVTGYVALGLILVGLVILLILAAVAD